MPSGVVSRRELMRAWAAHDVDVYRAFVDMVTKLTARLLSALRVLDLGCGSNAPITVLLHAAGCLTRDVLNALPDYSPEALTGRSSIIVAQKDAGRS
jgi:hypothetical protein